MARALTGAPGEAGHGLKLKGRERPLQVIWLMLNVRMTNGLPLRIVRSLSWKAHHQSTPRGGCKPELVGPSVEVCGSKPLFPWQVENMKAAPREGGSGVDPRLCRWM